MSKQVDPINKPEEEVKSLIAQDLKISGKSEYDSNELMELRNLIIKTYDVFKVKIEDLKAEFDEARAEFSANFLLIEQHCNKQYKINADFSGKVSMAENQIDIIWGEIKQIKMQVGEINRDICAVNYEVTEIIKENMETKMQLKTEIHSEINLLTIMMKKENNDFKSEMKKQMSDFKLEMNDFKSEMIDFKSEMNDFKSEMNDFKSEMNDFKSEMKAIIKKELSDLKADMDALTTKMDAGFSGAKKEFDDFARSTQGYLNLILQELQKQNK